MEVRRSFEGAEVRPHSGLEVRRLHEGPEVLSPQGVLAGSVQYPVYVQTKPGEDIEKGRSEAKFPAPVIHSMKKHRWPWLVGVLVLLLIVAVVGGAVGGTRHSKKISE